MVGGEVGPHEHVLQALLDVGPEAVLLHGTASVFYLVCKAFLELCISNILTTLSLNNNKYNGVFYFLCLPYERGHGVQIMSRIQIV